MGYDSDDHVSFPYFAYLIRIIQKVENYIQGKYHLGQAVRKSECDAAQSRCPEVVVRKSDPDLDQWLSYEVCTRCAAAISRSPARFARPVRILKKSIVFKVFHT